MTKTFDEIETSNKEPKTLEEYETYEELLINLRRTFDEIESCEEFETFEEIKKNSIIFCKQFLKKIYLRS